MATDSSECVLPHSEYTDRKIDIFILVVTQSMQNVREVGTVCFPFVPQVATVGCRQNLSDDVMEREW